MAGRSAVTWLLFGLVTLGFAILQCPVTSNVQWVQVRLLQHRNGFAHCLSLVHAACETKQTCTCRTIRQAITFAAAYLDQKREYLLRFGFLRRHVCQLAT